MQRTQKLMKKWHCCHCYVIWHNWQNYNIMIMKYVKMMYANEGGLLNDSTPNSKVVKKVNFVFCDISFEFLALQDSLNLVHILWKVFWWLIFSDLIPSIKPYIMCNNHESNQKVMLQSIWKMVKWVESGQMGRQW